MEPFSEGKAHPLRLNSLTLATLASSIKEYDPISIQLGIHLLSHHKKVHEIDEKKYLEDSLKTVEKYNPDILCVSSWSSNFPFNIELIRRFKSRNPNTAIIMGGYPSTFVPEETLSIAPEIDYLVRGEGELTLSELMGALKEGKDNLGNIKGISYRNSEGKIVHTPNRPVVKNLDDLPIPDYSSFAKKTENYIVRSSRGCVFHCKFCASRVLEGSPERRKSIKRMEKEIKSIDTNYIFFACNNFTTKKTWVEKICDKLKGSGIDWHCMSRIDTVNGKLIKKMAESGCEEISYGPESIVPRLLTKMGKINPSFVSKYLKLCWDIPLFSKEVGLITRANTVIGFPYEKKEELIKTLNYIVELNKKGIFSHASILSPFIGCEMWNQYVEGKYEIIRKNYEKAFFVEKYEHLPWAYPDAWMFKNQYMSKNEFEKIITEEWKRKV